MMKITNSKVLFFFLMFYSTLSSAEFKSGNEFQGFYQGINNTADLDTYWNLSRSPNANDGAIFIPQIESDRLRLTQDAQQQATLATLQAFLPGKGNKVVVEFDAFTDGSASKKNAGDGIALVLSDASVVPVAGIPGEGLGYAQKRSQGKNGFAGGWLAVGIDDYGNFAMRREDDGLTSPDGAQPTYNDRPQKRNVAVRGAGNGLDGYKFIRTTYVDQETYPNRNGHRYRITLDAQKANGEVWLSVEKSGSVGLNVTNYSCLPYLCDINLTANDQPAIPELFFLSFTASTGDASAQHEIQNLRVYSTQPFAPLNSRVHHFDFQFNETGSTLRPLDVVIRACGDAECNAENLIKTATTVTLNTDGELSRWVPVPDCHGMVVCEQLTANLQSINSTATVPNQITFINGIVQVALERNSIGLQRIKEERVTGAAAVCNGQSSAINSQSCDVFFQEVPPMSCVYDDFNRYGLNQDWIIKTNNTDVISPSITGDKRLRLTENAKNQAASASYQYYLPAKDNYIQIEFELFTYHGDNNHGKANGSNDPGYKTGADGLSFIFSDARFTPQVGALGGSLGYASSYESAPARAGFSGGWLGIGFDEYGGFSEKNKDSLNGNIGNNGTGPGNRKNNIAIRGSGSGTTGYHYIAGAAVNPEIDQNQFGHKYRITLNTTNILDPRLTIERKTTNSYNYYDYGNYSTILDVSVMANLDQAKVPDAFYLTFASSTGTVSNVHEVDNFKLCSIVPPVEIESQPHHFKFDFSNNGNANIDHEVTISACGDEACTDEKLIKSEVTLPLFLNGESANNKIDQLGGWIPFEHCDTQTDVDACQLLAYDNFIGFTADENSPTNHILHFINGKVKIALRRNNAMPNDVTLSIQNPTPLQMPEVPYLYSCNGTPWGENDTTETNRSCTITYKGLDVHHFEFIDYTSTGSTCIPHPVTIRACANEECTALITENVSLTISPISNGVWSQCKNDGLCDHLNSISNNTLVFSEGEVRVNLLHPSIEDVYLGVEASAPPLISNYKYTHKCNGVNATDNQSRECLIGFKQAGIIFNNRIQNNISNRLSEEISLTAFQSEEGNMGKCTPLFVGDKTLEFWNEYTNPTSGLTPLFIQTKSSNGNFSDEIQLNKTQTLQPNINLWFDNNGTAVFKVRYPDAGTQLLNISYYDTINSLTFGLSAQSNEFTHRPYGFCIAAPLAPVAPIVSDDDLLTDESTYSPYISAGTLFPLTITPKAWVDTDSESILYDDNGWNNLMCQDTRMATPNFELDDIELFPHLVAPTSGHTGIIAINHFNAQKATATCNAECGTTTLEQSVSEVGVFRFTVTAPPYLSMSIPSSTSAPVGVFIPDYFRVINGEVNNAYPSFSYMGQPDIDIHFEIAAYNTKGAYTNNYGSFPVSKQTWFDFMPDDAPSSIIKRGASTHKSRFLVLPEFNTRSYAGAHFQFTANKLSYSKLTPSDPNYIDGPYNLLIHAVHAADSTSWSNIQFKDNSNNITDAVLISDDSLTTRFGRLSLAEQHNGTLGKNLELPFIAQYWNGRNFVTNIEDSYTHLWAIHDDLLLRTPQCREDNTVESYLADPETALSATMGQGKASLQVAPPSKPEQTVYWFLMGDSDDLLAHCKNNSDIIQADSVEQPWLKFNYSGTVYTDPSTLINFSTQSSRSSDAKIIYSTQN